MGNGRRILVGGRARSIIGVLHDDDVSGTIACLRSFERARALVLCPKSRSFSRSTHGNIASTPVAVLVGCCVRVHEGLRLSESAPKFCWVIARASHQVMQFAIAEMFQTMSRFIWDARLS